MCPRVKPTVIFTKPRRLSPSLVPATPFFATIATMSYRSKECRLAFQGSKLLVMALPAGSLA
jgi:hypothetical protein